MPFTTEADVRLRFQLDDAAEAPAALIQSCIEDSHEQILRFLDPQYDVPSPPGPLVLAETFLAGAAVLRALASKQALDPRGVIIGAQRIEDGARFRELSEAAAQAVEQAWAHLEPYLLDRPATSPADATDTTPVL